MMLQRGLLGAARRLATQCTAPMMAVQNKSMTFQKPLGVGAMRCFGAGGNPRAHLLVDGTRPEHEDGEHYHDADALAHRPKYNIFEERGQLWVKGKELPPLDELYTLPTQKKTWLPLWPRQRMWTWGNYKLLMKAEFCFFYIPTVIVFGLVLPAFVTIYAYEEAIYTTMTIKVTGRQWYWVYEVECPTGDDEEDDD